MEPLIGRRRALALGAAVGASWLVRARSAIAAAGDARAIVMVWLAGGPSQRETFDPGDGTRAIATSAPGVRIAETFPALAEQMHRVALVRSLVGRENDHERATALGKTGFSPASAVVHPSIGAIACHARGEGAGALGHVAISPGRFRPSGGLLGARFDAFVVPDPDEPVPDLVARVAPERLARRIDDAGAIDATFAHGAARVAAARRNAELGGMARSLMSSPDVRAFDVRAEPASVRARYGDTRFGRACIAARRLIETGATCVEVTLDGWDAHVACREAHRTLARALDPALSALLADLAERDLLRSTIVLCAGEFGRTPTLNRLGGRDHHANGFSALVAGGRIRGGALLGATDPAGGSKVIEPRAVADLHATALAALGIDPSHQETAPSGRPIAYSEGAAIRELLV